MYLRPHGRSENFISNRNEIYEYILNLSRSGTLGGPEFTHHRLVKYILVDMDFLFYLM